MPNSPVATAAVFAALGDETRLELVSRLCQQGPASIARLTAGSKISRQAVTKHLRLMERSGLVRCSRRGRETVWRLEEQQLKDARRHLKAISARWDDALTRLKKFVEE